MVRVYKQAVGSMCLFLLSAEIDSSGGCEGALAACVYVCLYVCLRPCKRLSR